MENNTDVRKITSRNPRTGQMTQRYKIKIFGKQHKRRDCQIIPRKKQWDAPQLLRITANVKIHGQLINQNKQELRTHTKHIAIERTSSLSQMI